MLEIAVKRLYWLQNLPHNNEMDEKRWMEFEDHFNVDRGVLWNIKQKKQYWLRSQRIVLSY